MVDFVTSSLDQMVLALRASDGVVVDWSNWIAKQRETLLPEMIGVALFVATSWREVLSLQPLYQRMFSDDPLPAWRQGGVTDAIIESARPVIFFNILFLLYTLVQFPLTLGPPSDAEFWADLIIQITLLGLLLGSYGNVRSALRQRAKTEARAERVTNWLADKFDGMRVSFARLRRKAVLIFLASFSLVAAQMSPTLLRGFADVLLVLKAWAS